MSVADDHFKSSPYLVQIDEHLKSLSEADRQAEVKKVKGVFVFNIKAKDGKVGTWTLDLKNKGTMTKGAVAGVKADITIDVSDEDFVGLGEGTANGQKLFMAGKIKVKGAVMMATKLDAVISSAKKTKAKL
ncbi:hypothetical protein BGX34_005349 [Mortierella sp. NVP85]|nr:hypothetical protein BGX34_005349 [Mortierella sp. NVP85]